MDVVEQGDGQHRRDVLAGKRERFVGLIQQGVANSEACRIVGVNRRTGTRWRYGRTVINRAGERLHYPAVKTLRTRSRPSSVRYLTLAERIAIADLHRDGGTVTTIAAELGRAPSTISRELRRNCDPQQRYLPNAAQRIATSRQARPRERRVVSDAKLAAVVLSAPGEEVESPSQVAHELRVRFPDEADRQLCTESIYQAVYDPQTPLTRPAKRSLRSRRRRRRLRSTTTTRWRRLTAMTMIAARPAAVADRLRGRALGGRSDHGRRQPLRDRHPDRTASPLFDPDSHPLKRTPP